MSTSSAKPSRREQILQALASMLESNLGERITTASLAAEIGVSEAALYRHFPSKAKMFEGLIGFIEEAVFSRINLIMQDFSDAESRLKNIMFLVLGFSEKNPGLSRIIAGDALVGEVKRLHDRMHQFFERIEMQLKQVLRDAEMNQKLVPTQSISAAANMLSVYLEGQIRQFVRSEFKSKPTEHWPQQWPMLYSPLLRPIDLGHFAE